jgi:hypothetical protein
LRLKPQMNADRDLLQRQAIISPEAKMTKRDAIEIGTKLFGLYCLMTAIITIPVALMAFSTKHPWPLTSIILSCTIPILYFVLAMLFLSKGSMIVSLLTGESPAEVPLETREAHGDSLLSLWVVIIGLYYFVSSSTSVISQVIWVFLAFRDSYSVSPDSYHVSRLVAQILTLGMSLIFIFKSGRVVELINRVRVRNI